MARPRSGKLSERIWIQVRTVATSTDIGAPTETWALHHRTRAEVITTPGTERYQEAREMNVARRTFRIRYNPTTAPLVAAGGSGEYRVLYPSTSAAPWDVEDALNEEGMRRSILVTCVRRY